MDNRKLGWIAIGLGVVALLVALGGRTRPTGWYDDGPQFANRARPAAPAAPQGPGSQQWAGPQGRFGDQQGPGSQQWAGPQGRFGDQQGWGKPHGFGGPHGFGRFFFFPFMLIGGLFRLALFVLVIALLARWFFRRRDHQAPPPPSSSGPEQPPYTGGTQAL